MVFIDRRDAGKRLAEQLVPLGDEPDLIVVGLPRGGVSVAAEVASALAAPLDVIVVRKLGVPSQPELAMGAIGEDGVRVIDERVVRAAAVAPEEIASMEARERVELDHRAARFRLDRPRRTLAGKRVVIVDDGIATGSTARVACEVARAEGAAHVTLAVPVAPAGWTIGMAGVADDLVAIEAPEDFRAVGQYYADFEPTADDEVIELLLAAERRVAGSAIPDHLDRRTVIDEDVGIRIGGVTVAGHLRVPEHAEALVVFAHGSGSSRHSPRNRFVADALSERGLATLLFDLLTGGEEVDRANVFDVELLAKRLVGVTVWARSHPAVGRLPIAYFGASTGAAAALRAASDPNVDVTAVVSRGGRPDLAGPRLTHVRVPTLLIVGGDDDMVLELNRRARTLMSGECDLLVIPGAGHLFEEPGTLHAAAEAAGDWLLQHLPARTV